MSSNSDHPAWQDTLKGNVWLEEEGMTNTYGTIGEEPIAVFSDVHSNLHALERLFTACTERGIRRYFCLGDIVGYSAFPEQCLSAVRRLKCPTIMGNHDQRVAKGYAGYGLNSMARAGVEYSVEQLSFDHRRWLFDLPLYLTIGPVTLVHASLPMPHMWHYILSDTEAEYSMENQETPVCFFGHTHLPKLYTAPGSKPAQQQLGDKWLLDRNGKYAINPGSVGQPRGGDPRAQFAIFDPKEFTVEFVRLAYDVEAAATAIMKAGLPDMLAERLFVGR